MAQINVNIEMNEKLADKFEQTCKSLGLDMEDAFNIFAQKVVNEKGIPFEVNEEDYPNSGSKKEACLDLVRKVTMTAGALTLAAGLLTLICKCRPRKK